MPGKGRRPAHHDFLQSAHHAVAGTTGGGLRAAPAPAEAPERHDRLRPKVTRRRRGAGSKLSARFHAKRRQLGLKVRYSDDQGGTDRPLSICRVFTSKEGRLWSQSNPPQDTDQHQLPETHLTDCLSCTDPRKDTKG